MIRVLSFIESAQQARAELAVRGLDFSDYDQWRRWLPVRALRRLGLLRPAFQPDPVKGWDVLQAIDILTATCRPVDPVLDLGCKDSEMLPCLAALGFTHLTGMDLDPSVRRQPRFRTVSWEVGDFYETRYPAGSFKAITAISTIEHGVDLDRLVREVARLLSAGGLFLFSTDYHARKLDTSSVRTFGLDWLIFSRDEILHLLSSFEQAGLTPIDDVLLEHESSPIRWLGYQYTFLFGALVKRG